MGTPLLAVPANNSLDTTTVIPTKSRAAKDNAACWDSLAGSAACLCWNRKRSLFRHERAAFNKQFCSIPEGTASLHLSDTTAGRFILFVEQDNADTVRLTRQ